MATPRVAAGALFFDEAGRVLLVKPAYKEGWDIPGGYVEPGESPRAACIREIREELDLLVAVGSHLVVDWAPAEGEGDKMLFIFNAGTLADEARSNINLRDGELTDWRLVADADLDSYLPARLSRRVHTAISAMRRGVAAYAENGNEPVAQ
jgi:8-oxo-dGTP diphosphatase